MIFIFTVVEEIFDFLRPLDAPRINNLEIINLHNPCFLLLFHVLNPPRMTNYDVFFYIVAGKKLMTSIHLDASKTTFFCVLSLAIVLKYVIFDVW